jgi:hypothetical protein
MDSLPRRRRGRESQDSLTFPTKERRGHKRGHKYEQMQCGVLIIAYTQKNLWEITKNPCKSIIICIIIYKIRVVCKQARDKTNGTE